MITLFYNKLFLFFCGLLINVLVSIFMYLFESVWNVEKIRFKLFYCKFSRNHLKCGRQTVTCRLIKFGVLKFFFSTKETIQRAFFKNFWKSFASRYISIKC